MSQHACLVRFCCYFPFGNANFAVPYFTTSTEGVFAPNFQWKCIIFACYFWKFKSRSLPLQPTLFLQQFCTVSTEVCHAVILLVTSWYFPVNQRSTSTDWLRKVYQSLYTSVVHATAGKCSGFDVYLHLRLRSETRVVGFQPGYWSESWTQGQSCGV